MFRAATRYAGLLALGTWIGSLIFFVIVAYVAFTVLPTKPEAGLVVGSSLRLLHSLGIGCGAVTLVCLFALGAKGHKRAHASAIALTLLMLALTVISQFVIIPAMERHRAAVAGQITSLPASNPDRTAFDRLHHVSTQVEGVVLFAGLIVLGCITLEPKPAYRQLK